MKFVHTSDWHIGYTQYNLEERFNDFFSAAYYIAKEIVDKIKPDFVIHTGDIFHHSKPSPGAIRQAVKVLTLIKDANIPFYIIRGNHDAKTSKELSFGGTALKLLADLKLVRYLNDETIHIEKLKTSITGVGHYFGELAQKKVRDVVSQTDFPPSNFRILAVHNFIEGQLDNISETISTGLISDLNFDYVAAGHYHIPWIKERINVWVPGSSEATSANDWRRDDLIDGQTSIYSTFYVITAERDNSGWKKDVERKRILVRPKISLEIVPQSKDAFVVQSLIENKIQNAIAEMNAHVKEHDNEFLNRYPNYKKNKLSRPIVRIKVISELRTDEFSLLDFEKIKKELKLLKLDIINQQEDEESYIPSETLSALHIDEIIKSISEEIGGKELYPLVQFTINQFKDRPSSREFSEKEVETFIKEAEQLVSETIEENKNEIKKSRVEDGEKSIRDSIEKQPPISFEKKEDKILEHVSGTLEDWLS